MESVHFINADNNLGFYELFILWYIWKSLGESKFFKGKVPSRSEGGWWEQQSWKAETTFHFCWWVKSSFQLVWMESTTPCNSLLGQSFSGTAAHWSDPYLFWQKPVLTFGRDHSCFRLTAQSSRVQIQQEVISDLKRENQFLSQDIWESIWLMIDLLREICKPVLKLDFNFTAHGIVESLAEFELCCPAGSWGKLQ